MKILYLSTWFPYPPTNGSKLRAYYLTRTMAKKHEVTVAAFEPEAHESRCHTDIPGLQGVPVWGIVDDPFRYVDLPQALKYLSPIPLSVWPSRKMQKAVREVSGREAWDAIVAFQTPAAQYAFNPMSAPRVFDIDNSFSFTAAERLHTHKSLVARLRARLSLAKSMHYESRLARRFDTCTVVSSLEVDHIQRLVDGAPCRIEVSSNGVDCSHNRPGVAVPRPAALVYNGSLTYSANYDAVRWFLAEIWPTIRAHVPDATLTITGSTAGVDLRGLALDDSVHLTGYVEDVRIPVAEAAVAVAPIRQGGGTRLKILEAMALGTPVVATSKGAEGLDVADGEHLLLEDDPQRFAAAVLRLLADPSLAAHLRRNARQLVEERYDWDTIGRRFAALVEETAARAGAKT